MKNSTNMYGVTRPRDDISGPILEKRSQITKYTKKTHEELKNIGSDTSGPFSGYNPVYSHLQSHISGYTTGYFNIKFLTDLNRRLFNWVFYPEHHNM